MHVFVFGASDVALEKIMQESCKTNQIVSLNQYSLSSWHFMNTQRRNWTVLATSLAQSQAALAGVARQLRQTLHHLAIW